MNIIEHIRQGLEFATSIIELFAVLVIISGFIRASVAYILTRRATDREKAFVAFRSRLGMNMLLGLEILVIADVIESITVEPSYMSLTVLALQLQAGGPADDGAQLSGGYDVGVSDRSTSHGGAVVYGVAHCLDDQAWAEQRRDCDAVVHLAGDGEDASSQHPQEAGIGGDEARIAALFAVF